MKKIYFISIFYLVLSGLYLKAQLPPEILYYNFNTPGPNVPNLASSPPPGTTTGTIVGGLTIGGSGQCGNALVGNGSSTDYVNTAWTTSLTGSWTISFWTSNIPPSATLFYIFGDANAGSFRCFTNGVAAANNWMLRGTGLTDIIITGGAVLAPQLNTFVYDATAGKTTGYLNGVFNASVTQGPVSITGVGPFKVGQYGANVGLPNAGLMDEFRIYSRALTPAEVLQLANPTPSAIVITTVSCGSYTSLASNVYSTSGTYTESVNSCNAVVTNTLNLTINIAPTLTVTASNPIICNGESTNLFTNGTATTFSWSTGATASSTTVNPSSTSVYTVVGNIGSCSITRTVDVQVNPSPLINLSSTSPSVCAGNSVTLFASGSPSYSWSPISSPGNSVAVFPTPGLVYTVSSTNAFSCTTSKTIEIQVELFVPSVSSPTSICSGKSANLIASGGLPNTYLWSNGMPFQNITVNPLVNTVYTVTANSTNGCLGSNSVSVSVIANPTVVATAASTTICRGEAHNLTASGANSYIWFNSGTGSVTVITPSLTGTFNYSVTGVANNGCEAIGTISIKVNACVGLAEQHESQVQYFVFPNPSNGQFQFTTSNEKPMVLEIFSLTGSMIQEITLEKKGVIDLSNQTSGLYILLIKSEGQVIANSLLIKN